MKELKRLVSELELYLEQSDWVEADITAELIVKISKQISKGLNSQLKAEAKFQDFLNQIDES